MAKKYIDSEKLIAEIEKRIIEHRKSLKKDITSISEATLKGSLCAYKSIEHFIDSLQQEQPEVDLEKEIDKEWKNCCPIDEGMGDESALLVIEQFHQIASHFCELGRKQVLQEIYDGKTKPVDKITAVWLDDK